MARFIEKTAAELKVLSARAERGPWEPPPVISSAVLIGEHLRHTGVVGTTEVESDMCLIDRDAVAVWCRGQRWAAPLQVCRAGVSLVARADAAWQPLLYAVGTLAGGQRLFQEKSQGPRGSVPTMRPGCPAWRLSRQSCEHSWASSWTSNRAVGATSVSESNRCQAGLKAAMASRCSARPRGRCLP